VIYEAGYFSGAKGFKNSLIVKEDDVKIPTDLGGIKFVKLENREDISTIKTPIREYLQRICESDQ
jgi:predicted nucleotide-binding protein